MRFVGIDASGSVVGGDGSGAAYGGVVRRVHFYVLCVFICFLAGCF